MVLNLTVGLYLRNVISSFVSKKPGEIPIFRTFLAKDAILAYISLLIGYLGKIDNYDVIVRSYMGCLYFFGIYEKKKPNSYTMVYKYWLLMREMG